MHHHAPALLSPTLLCILDGVGLNPETRANAVALADTPCLDRLFSSCPHSTLTTHGPAVGLPTDQMGNSEVGHLNIGGGRVIEQWLVRINRELKTRKFREASAYKSFLGALDEKSTIHLIGLFSDGGVHSHCDHLVQLLQVLSEESRCTIALHLLTDGRDTAPNRAREQIISLQHQLDAFPRCHIATLGGRFYGMDRDKRWERTERAFETIAFSSPKTDLSPVEYIEGSYSQGITDEFVEPVAFDDCPVKPNDAVVFWNFREDRMRQIVAALCLEDFVGFPRKAPLFDRSRTLCFTEYDETFGLPVLFHAIDIRRHLGEVVSSAGLKQLRVAETEKYPHVTYFLNGGIEAPYPGEERIVVPSPRDVKTYDQKPEMSAEQVCQTVIEGIQSGKYALIVVNFANGDMVGHTGVIEAAVKAVETVDRCLDRILSALQEKKGKALIIADHGNAEMMVNYETGEPHTAHTTFPVPVIYFCSHPENEASLRPGGSLCDVAPTILEMMDLEKPIEMTGTSLFS